MKNINVFLNVFLGQVIVEGDVGVGVVPEGVVDVVDETTWLQQCMTTIVKKMNKVC